MNRLPQIRYALLALTLIGNSAAALKADEEKSKPVTVPKILKVTHQIPKSHPRNWFVNVIGEVPTGGYTNAKLEKAVYVTPPKDGIQDYFLKAVPPSGPAITVISQVKSLDLWVGFPSWVKGIRVHGVDDGIVVVKFDPEPVRRRFAGTSNAGSFEQALAAAVAKLNDALSEGKVADATATWKIIKTSGQVGGIAGLNQISVTIVAERQPAWPQKEETSQPKKKQ